jgi:nitrogen fixation protein FixH
VLFFAGTVGLIVMACSQKVDLVSADYYEQELKFQGRIDRVERTQRTTTQAAVAYDLATHSITISLPAGQAEHEVSGRIELYRPSAAGLDRAVQLVPDANGVQRLDAAAMVPGLWKVRVSWTVGNQDYFLDQKVVVGAKATWPRASMRRTNRQQCVAADVSRRILAGAKMAPTDVGGYLGAWYSS